MGGIMSLADLLPEVHALPHPDKLRLLQFLADDLARAEGLSEVRPEATYPIWAPYDALEAAAVMDKVLQDDGAGR